MAPSAYIDICGTSYKKDLSGRQFMPSQMIPGRTEKEQDNVSLFFFFPALASTSQRAPG
jgi:hypothetical protein